MNDLISNQHTIEALWSAVNTSAGSLVNVAPLMDKIMSTQAWRERKLLQLGGKIVRFNTFSDFVTTRPLEGCGWSVEKLEMLVNFSRQLRHE